MSTLNSDKRAIVKDKLMLLLRNEPMRRAFLKRAFGDDSIKVETDIDWRTEPDEWATELLSLAENRKQLSTFNDAVEYFSYTLTTNGDFIGRDKVTGGDRVDGDKVGGDKISFNFHFYSHLDLDRLFSLNQLYSEVNSGKGYNIDRSIANLRELLQEKKLSLAARRYHSLRCSPIEFDQRSLHEVWVAGAPDSLQKLLELIQVTSEKRVTLIGSTDEEKEKTVNALVECQQMLDTEWQWTIEELLQEPPLNQLNFYHRQNIDQWRSVLRFQAEDLPSLLNSHRQKVKPEWLVPLPVIPQSIKAEGDRLLLVHPDRFVPRLPQVLECSYPQIVLGATGTGCTAEALLLAWQCLHGVSNISFFPLYRRIYANELTDVTWPRLLCWAGQALLPYLAIMPDRFLKGGQQARSAMAAILYFAFPSQSKLLYQLRRANLIQQGKGDQMVKHLNEELNHLDIDSVAHDKSLLWEGLPVGFISYILLLDIQFDEATSISFGIEEVLSSVNRLNQHGVVTKLFLSASRFPDITQMPAHTCITLTWDELDLHQLLKTRLGLVGEESVADWCYFNRSYAKADHLIVERANRSPAILIKLIGMMWQRYRDKGMLLSYEEFQSVLNSIASAE
jgi:hypothetical protein